MSMSGQRKVFSFLSTLFIFHRELFCNIEGELLPGSIYRSGHPALKHGKNIIVDGHIFVEQLSNSATSGIFKFTHAEASLVKVENYCHQSFRREAASESFKCIACRPLTKIGSQKSNYFNRSVCMTLCEFRKFSG